MVVSVWPQLVGVRADDGLLLIRRTFRLVLPIASHPLVPDQPAPELPVLYYCSPAFVKLVCLGRYLTFGAGCFVR